MRQFFPFAVLLCLISCAEDRHASMAFNQAESLLFTAPDSALALVRRIDGQTLSSRTLQARHALLMTIAQDKCYIDVAEDSTVRVAYDYYKKHGREWDRLMATYYLGVIQQNAKEYINAALAFREAEPLAEELRDYRQYSLIEQHLCRIFAMNYDHARALEYAEKALKAAELAGESLMADYCRLDIANQCLARKEYKHAEVILSQILDNEEINSDLRYRALLAMIRLLIYMPESDMSLAKEYLEDIHKITRPEMLENNTLYLTTMAIVYENNGEKELSNRCLEQVSSLLYTPTDSLLFLGSQGNIMKKRGDWEQAYHAFSLAMDKQDRIVTGLLDQSVTHSMERYFTDKWEIERIRFRSQLYLLILIGTISFISILALFFVLRSKNRKLLEDMAKIQEVGEDVNRLRSGESVSSRIVDQLILDKVRSLQHLSESYFSWDDMAIKKREEKNGIFFKDEIISTFRMQLSELRNDHAFITSLEQSLDLTNDGIMKKARLCLRNEKELDFSILTLLFTGFSIKSISYLLRMSEASLRMRKTRFKQQFEAMYEPVRGIFLNKLG